MIIPVSPVDVKSQSPEVIYAKDQPQYRQLPAIRYEDGTVITRWRCAWSDRIRILFSGNIYLKVLTFNSPLQPVMLSVTSLLDTKIPDMENADN